MSTFIGLLLADRELDVCEPSNAESDSLDVEKSVAAGRADRESSIAEASITVCIDSDTSVFMATLWR